MMKFITSTAVLISSMYGPGFASTTPNSQFDSTAQITQSTQPAATVVAISATTSFVDNTNVVAYVKSQYASEPILIDIARCESNFRQFDSKTGEVLHGTKDNQDIGVMQINEQYQGAKAASMGYDIDTVEGNVAYAAYLYQTQGAAPWSASSPCWSKAYTSNITSPSTDAIAVK